MKKMRKISFNPGATTAGMILIDRGTFTMGSENFYPEEAPLHRVKVDAFWIDETAVTNRAFSRFVEATGHVTIAERAPDPKDYPGMLPGMNRAGSLVFQKTTGPTDLRNPTEWWHFEFGADWRHPRGPDSSLEGLEDHPVVHVAYSDAAAYAKWARKDLPTEAEWEFAARGGLEARDYAWGDELAPGGEIMANYWLGQFPFENQGSEGRVGTMPVKSYPANGYGLFDMIGNTWEWTRDWWSDRQGKISGRGERPACCAIDNPRGARLKDSFDPCQPSLRIGRKVLKGGSHLCAENYCQRYRPAARHPETIDTSTTHIGFRCVVRCLT